MVSKKGSRTTPEAITAVVVVLFAARVIYGLAAASAQPQSSINYASVIEGAVAANGRTAFLVSDGDGRERLFVSNVKGRLVPVEVADEVEALSFERLRGLTIAEDGSFLLVVAVVPGEGEFPLQCKLVGTPSCQLVRLNGSIVREARLLEGGRKMLLIPLQEQGDFRPLGATLLDTGTGKLTKVAAGYYVESVLWLSRSTLLLKIAEVRQLGPRFGVARVDIGKDGVPKLRRLH